MRPAEPDAAADGGRATGLSTFHCLTARPPLLSFFVMPHRERTMATCEELIAIIGLPVDAPRVRALVAADGLTASEEPEGWSVPRRSYLSCQAAGYSLTHELGRVTTAFLYAEPAEGFAPFAGPLPGGFPRGTTRRRVLDEFGVPERSGQQTTIVGLGPQGAWDRFAIGSVRMHFQYTVVGDLIRLVSIMAADVAP
jgi:hypothetical protein